MAGLSFRDGYEFDPDTYDVESGGLLGRLLALQAEQGQYQPNPGNGGQVPVAPQSPDFGLAPRTRIIVRPSDAYSPFDPETYGSQGDLPAKPREPQSAQSPYQPIGGNNAALPAGSAIPPAAQQYGGDPAQPAREAAMARLVCGIGNLTAARAPRLTSTQSTSRNRRASVWPTARSMP
jgi:hypothetical protein